MAARKLHMPGARERIGGGSGAAAEGVVQNGNGVCVQPAAGNRYESRLASPIMQPLPLASRYGGDKHDNLRPASSALQSSWIQRLRPASPEASCRELGHEVVHVWKDPKPALWRSNTPLLLAGPSKEPLHHILPKVEPPQQQHKADDVADMGLMTREQAGASKAPTRIIDCVDKGKGRSQVQSSTPNETTMNAGQRKKDNSGTAHAQQVKPPVSSSCLKGFVAVEGSSRRPGFDSPQEGSNGMPMPLTQNTQPNGVSGALVRGFGPLRVVLKAAIGSTVNKSVGSSAKLKGPMMEGLQSADVPPSGSHYMAGPDRSRVALCAGPQVTMTWVPGSSTHPTIGSSPDLTMAVDHGRQILRPGELFGGGIYPLQATGYGSENCTPFMHHHSQASGKDWMFGHPSCSNGNRIGEDHTVRGWYPAFSPIGSGVHRAGKGMVGTHSFCPVTAEDGRIDSAQQQEGKYHDRTNPDEGGKHMYVANGLEARKAKEVVVMDKCYADVGRSRQGSHLSPPFAPYQSPSHISFGNHPLAFSPARSPSHRNEEEAHIGDEARDTTQERPEQTASLTPLFSPPKLRQGGTEGTSVKPPWSSLFAAYKVPNQPGEPPNSNSSTGTLPLDGRVRVHEGQHPGNRVSSGRRATGNQDNESGSSAQIGAHPAASSAEARSLFDNQSSHFSSSPWALDDGHNPTDDAGSAFHSQASHTLSQFPSAVQVPNKHFKGQENSRYKHDLGGSSIGGSKDVSYKRARSREDSGSLSPGPRNSSGAVEGSRGPRSTDEENHVRGTVKNSRPPPLPSVSGQKDDTSGSSPPSLPVGCNNSSDLCSPAFPGASVEDRGKSRAVHSRTANLESEAGMMQLDKRQQGMTSTPGGLFARRRDRSEPQGQIKLGPGRDPREAGARLCKDMERQEAQPMVGEAFREVGSKMGRPNGMGNLGQKQSRQRNSTDVVVEAGISVPSKRSRHHTNHSTWHFQGGVSGVQPGEQENGVGTGKPSSWLSRWLPAGSSGNGLGAGMNSPTSARPREGHWNGLVAGYPASGRINCSGGLSGDGRSQGNRIEGHVRRVDENGSDQRGNMKDISSKRSVFGLPPFSTPSAAAMALVGTAARKLGPLPSQRKGPFAMWPSVHLETAQTPEPQRSVQSPELPTYVEHS